MLAAATNLVTKTDFSNWIAASSTTLTDGSGYLGEPSKIFEASGGTHRTFRTPPIETTAGTTYTGSFWIRRVSGTGTIQLYHQYSAQGNLTNITSEISEEWTRVERTFTGNASNGDIWFGIWVNTQGDSVEIAMPQVEEGSVATSFSSLPPTASNLGLVATLDNRVSGGANATQTTATKQPRAHVPVGDGHLYIPAVSSNFASVNAPVIPATADFDISIDFIINQFASGTGYSHLLSQYQGSVSGRLHFGFYDHQKLLYFFCGGDGTNPSIDIRTSVDAITEGQEHTARVTRVGNTVALYLDGSLQQTATSGVAILQTSTTQIGWGNGRGLNGAILSVSEGSNTNIDFSDADHKASSFTCSTGQTVTINKSNTEDPATLVRRPFLRFDGSDNFMSGLFNQSLTSGGYMFVAFSVNYGSETYARVFAVNSTDPDETDYNNPRGLAFSLRQTTADKVGWYYNNAFQDGHDGTYDEDIGAVLHELKAVDGEQVSKVNNADAKTKSLDLSGLSSEKFTIGGRYDGNGNAAIDLEYLYLFDETLTDGEATKVRDYINSASSIF